MSVIDIHIHVVWGTKYREPILTRPVRTQIIHHLKIYAEEQGIWLDHVNGHLDHLHCLLKLQHNQTISQTVKLLKGESSRWINQNSVTEDYFKWAKGYYAASVSKEKVEVVRNYIRNQEIHHSRGTIKDDLEVVVYN